ncbi:hypothetical protein [Allocoleopsis franciscana]|uniref:Uncharacterized protein n=1 Tax=Allocoleopsis franciscana PCC 7113 TaxID=1173027 RepID=K9WPE1_9CYAN|nr:hypothetical protein [Allocoleopsis franciscana]AFZ21639.1 hypothetical protein Mic7113_6039 [Allocoleopsis franciscana PCC 7113]
MDAQLTSHEINHYREILQGDDSAQKALTTLEQYDGRFYDSFDELLSQVSGPTKSYDLARLRQAMLKQVREQLCENEHFGTRFQEYSHDLASTALFAQLIVCLEELAAAQEFPFAPAIAAMVVFYLVKIGLNIFCEYTETSVKPPTDDPLSRRIPHD